MSGIPVAVLFLKNSAAVCLPHGLNQIFQNSEDMISPFGIQEADTEMEEANYRKERVSFRPTFLHHSA